MAKNIKSDDIATSGAVVKKSHLMSPSTLMTIIFCSLYFLMYLDRINISMAAKPIMREFNLSNAGLGIVFSAFSWPYLVGQWIGGWSANRFGVRNVLTFCVFLVAVATLAGGIAIGLAVLCAARLFVGIGEGPVFSAATQGMKHWYSGKRYGFIQGVTHGASRFGAAVSPIIVAWCIVISGWRAAFFVCAVLTLIWVALWWWNFVEDPRDHPNITEAEVAELVPPNKQVRHVRTPWWPLIKRIFPVTAVEFTTGWMTWVFISWLPLYFMSRFHLDLKSSAMHTAIALISGVIGDIFGGLASDWILVKTGNKRLARNAFIALCLLLAGGFLAATMLTHNIFLVTLFLFATFFFAEALCGAIWAIPMDITHEYAGIASGIMNSGYAMAGVVSPIVFGWVLDHFKDWDVAFLITVGICVVGAFLTIFMRPDRPFLPPEAVLDSRIS